MNWRGRALLLVPKPLIRESRPPRSQSQKKTYSCHGAAVVTGSGAGVPHTSRHVHSVGRGRYGFPKLRSFHGLEITSWDNCADVREWRLEEANVAG